MEACSITSRSATAETASDAVREQLEQYMVEQPCPTCGGRRLKPESLSVMWPARTSARS